MSSYDLIKDLERKLALYKDTHPSRVASPNSLHERIAHYIHAAHIYPRPLNRDNVTALLEGRDSWPTVAGAEFCLAYPVDVSELEQARVIAFPDDYLAVQPKVPSTPDMPPKLRHQLDAHTLLYELRYLNDVWEPPQLRLCQEDVTSIDLAFLRDTFESRAEGYRLKVKREDLKGVGTFLWKRLIDGSVDPDTAFSNYITRMRLAAGSIAIFQIDFDLDIDVKQYLDCAFNYIAADKTLFDSWADCAANVAISHNRVNNIIKKPSPLVVRKRPGQPDEVSQEAESYCEALDFSQLESMIYNLASSPPTTLIEGAKWWKDVTHYRFQGIGGISEHLVHLILQREHNLYSPRDSFPLTRKLIDLAHRSPKLVGALFSDIYHPPYLCFLLSNPKTNQFGLIGVYENIERNMRPISEYASYEKNWGDLVWTQALEIFYNSYEQYVRLPALPEAIDQLCEMIAWFANHEINYNSRHKLIADTRLPSLQKTISTVRYLDDSRQVRYLIEDHRQILINRAHEHLQKARIGDRYLPLGGWLILFWCLDWDLASSKSHHNSSSHALDACGALIDSYLGLLYDRLNGDTNAVDDPLAFDELEWLSVYINALAEQRERWISALDDQPAIDSGDPAKEKRDTVFAARMHTRLLLKLFTQTEYTPEHAVEKRIFASKLMGIIERFGFYSEWQSGIFDYLHDNSDYSPIKLWPTVCNVANNFTPIEFQELIAILRRREAPLRALFIMLERTTAYENKKLVVGLLAERNLEEAATNWTPEAFDIILKAANNGQMKIAREYLDYVRKYSHKTFKNKTAEISAKLDLKDIFDNKKLPDQEKINRLCLYKISSEEQQITNEVQSFKRYLIASLTMFVDHAKALEMFSSVLDVEQTLQNATGLIKVALSWPTDIARPEPLEFYLKRWLDTYQTTFKTDLAAKLSDVELNYILQLCLETEHFDDFKRFWNVASPQQQKAYELAPLRAEYLKRMRSAEEALSYLQQIRISHRSFPLDVEEKIAAIENSLRSTGTVGLSKPQPILNAEIDSSHDKLRLAWLTIKDMNAYDQSQIFMNATTNIDEYLFELVEHVGRELLKRNGNLQRKKLAPASASTIMLDEEDMINDWFVSLVCQRMSFLNWTMPDQSRTGRSGSGKGVGETDGWVRDGRGNPVFLFEGFRLGNYIDTTQIDEHLNKIGRYNSMGMSTVFVVIYVATENFSRLCESYVKHVEKCDYRDFDDDYKSGLQLITTQGNSFNARYYKETRKINQSDVNIYHHLLHLKPPMDSDEG
ncbi:MULTISPECIES: hypothetical protein [unclassified Pseudomonas]|uniref:hypothetical protein n=1 Tax=unclassified Pseudomonas TaxID=196821 RepID=UPI000484C16B|nr:MULTISPECIES: hypothetical protein [unclassified Pseudomonas]SCX30870.1 hypothetical protein SAMN03159437_03516 [Pseudomonas sp. NFACC25]SMF50169.1 hypothetical protein SAMN05660912_03986 [Pseudomonas sp. LAMO17WK12:I1]